MITAQAEARVVTVTAVDTATGRCSVDAKDDGGAITEVSYYGPAPEVGRLTLMFIFSGHTAVLGSAEPTPPYVPPAHNTESYPKTARGRATISLTAASNGNVTVTFPAGFFPSTPRVVTTQVNSSNYLVQVVPLPASVTIWIRHYKDTVGTVSVTLDWIAVENEVV